VTPFLLLLGAPCLLLVLGIAAAAAGRRARAAEVLGAYMGAGVNLLGLAATIAAALMAGGASLTISLPWMPAIGGSFSLTLDPLACLFLCVLYLLSASCSLFGGPYLRASRAGTRAGSSWLAFHALTASMAMVVLAANGVLFLAAWEIMTFSSWFLVTFEHEDERARHAGVTYLVASQIGAAFLLALFTLLGAASPGAEGAALDFSRFGALPVRTASTAFLLGLVGFGTKAGVMPLHVWLPEAHPAAPSHVSALMSGVMIKTGIYGILRLLGFLGGVQAWWGWTLLAVGVVSGVLGVLYALAQHDIKRLLAYHSVENIGIICIGLGVGVLGAAGNMPLVSLLGFGGALLHVVNHALFKGLLFLGAGSAAGAAGTRALEALGGLMKRMPATGILFLVGAAAICGLPPLNGFVSELLVITGAVRAVTGPGAALAAAGAAALAAMALIGGLAIACFAKAFGIAFLGEPRSAGAAAARESPAPMIAAMAVIAAACAAVGLLGSAAVRVMAPLLATFAGVDETAAADLLGPARGSLGMAAVVAGAAVAAALVLAGLRALLLSRRQQRRGPTWDCGYAAPAPRMQYTASSFAAPLLSTFRAVVPARHAGPRSLTLFPEKASYHSEAPDIFEHGVFRPLFAAVGRLFSRLGWLQHGNLRLYVLYIALTLLVLLVWNLG
jgi:hydrogenase-4 component B